MSKPKNSNKELFGDSEQPDSLAGATRPVTPSVAATPSSQAASSKGPSEADSETQIRQIMRSTGATREQAWSKYHAIIANFVSNGKLGWDETKASKSTAAAVTTSPMQAFKCPQNSPRAATPQPKADIDSLEKMIPDQQRKNGMSVLEAAKLGLVNLDDHHPDAALLSSAIAERIRLDGVGDDAKSSIMEEICQKQLFYPYRKLPLRSLPTDFNQTSLFHVAANNTPRRQLKNEPMGRIGDSIDLYYNGEELRHDDEANFMQLLWLSSGSMPAVWINVNNAPFLRGSKGVTRYSVKDAVSIDESLARMRGAYILIRNKNRNSWITLNLLQGLEGSGSQRRVMLDPRLVILMQVYTPMDQQLLYKLKGVSRQIFKYLSTIPHIGVYPTKITSYFELCYGKIESLHAEYLANNPDKTASDANIAITKKVSNFRRVAFPQALTFLRDDMGLIAAFDINNEADKVNIVKSRISYLNGDDIERDQAAPE